MNTTIAKRQNKSKRLLLENLTKTPIVQIACEKSGIGRATYYRWREQDQDFSTEADKALENGILLINDMAESQLISAIKDRNITATQYWLKHHHSKYKNKLEITAKKDDETLTQEQEELVTKALLLASIIDFSVDNKET
ncbi:MAG: phBC6A51 family helix-turn-helix protein [Patescibacteria group bacterium]